MKRQTTKTDILKKQMIDALEKTLGVVTLACKKVGVHRSTFYDWYNTDNDFKKEVDDINEIALDFAESKLHAQIEGENVTAIIFYLKTKGKKRGYVERSEIEYNQTGPDLSGLTTDQIIELLND